MQTAVDSESVVKLSSIKITHTKQQQTQQLEKVHCISENSGEGGGGISSEGGGGISAEGGGGICGGAVSGGIGNNNTNSCGILIGLGSGGRRQHLVSRGAEFLPHNSGRINTNINSSKRNSLTQQQRCK